ncbi:MAG: hypothetical protein HFI93_04795 [Lachnospiraceae bacterium]|nr:hypothetical protein [Lachnospiraceae bacterium]
MKKSNFITLALFILLIFVASLTILFRRAGSPDASQPAASEDQPTENPEKTKGIETLLADAGQPETTVRETQSPEPLPPQTTVPETSAPETRPAETEPTAPEASRPAAGSSDNVLFIGDSRTVGLFEYAGIEKACFFCDIGMSVYNIYEKTISVPGVGKVQIEELLQNQKYGKIYLMLGVNELGYHFEQTMAEYQKLVTYIQDKQPDALLFLQANLHVTRSRSEQDPVINNPAIDKLNAAISKLADGQNIYYLDANPLFDDAEGNLSSDKSEDNAHLYARYYPEWGAWITEQTAIHIGG